MSPFNIAVIVGSLRRDSFNAKLAKAIAKLAPDEFTLKYSQSLKGRREVQSARTRTRCP